ncbi:MAG: hypothetical protein IPK13_10835 [Deltaproteobacteria bacterium]|nr:hypothetical protein [Deltaproteobacteria bacterium]
MACLFLFGMFGACQGAPEVRGEPAFLAIENQSQYELIELRVHSGIRYLETENLLASPLRPGDVRPLYGSGEFYVTVYRERYRLGPVYAFTTAYPIHLLDDTGYRLAVFDESFRLDEIPWRAPNSWRLRPEPIRILAQFVATEEFASSDADAVLNPAR